MTDEQEKKSDQPVAPGVEESTPEASTSTKHRALRAWRLLSYALLRATGPQGRRRWKVLAIGLVAIVVWQLGFGLDHAKIDTRFRNTAASGMHLDSFFVYFLWYENLFPVVSRNAYEAKCPLHCDPTHESRAPTAELSKEAAHDLIEHEGNTLMMDAGWTWYAGDRGKIFLYLFDCVLKGKPFQPSVRPFHRLAWNIALCALFFSFWRIRRPWLGGLSVLFLGSNPFQIFEVFINENVFGWSITTAVLLLAIHLPLMVGKPIRLRWIFLWPIGTALMMATIRTFRSEPMPMLLGALFAYSVVQLKSAQTFSTLSTRRTWLVRALLIATFFGCFSVGGALWNQYFTSKHREAVAVLERVGGHPYPGDNLRMYHHFWHPVWCGLGDFDTKYGYVWDDPKALAYAQPILETKYNQYVPSPHFGTKKQTDEEFIDKEHLYKKLPYDIPNYNEVIRDKVLGDIKNDPGWYATIIVKRIGRVLAHATPIRLASPLGWWELPLISGRWFLPFLVLLFKMRARFAMRLLLFTTPTVTTALIVFCDKGIEWYGIFHLFMAAVVVLTVGGLIKLGWPSMKARIKKRGRARAD